MYYNIVKSSDVVVGFINIILYHGNLFNRRESHIRQSNRNIFLNNQKFHKTHNISSYAIRPADQYNVYKE